MAFDPDRVKSLFLEASEFSSPEERAAYLDRECGGEPELRARVEALLAAEDRAGPVPEAEVTGVFDPTPAEPSKSDPGGANRPRVVGGPGRRRDGGAPGVEPDGTRSSPAAPAVSPAGFVPGQVIAGRYTLREVLGEGGMGTVYRA